MVSLPMPSATEPLGVASARLECPGGAGGQLQPQAVNRPGGCRYKSWSPCASKPPSLTCLPRALQGSPGEVSPAREGVGEVPMAGGGELGALSSPTG